VSSREEIKNCCFTAVGVADNGGGFLVRCYFILPKNVSIFYWSMLKIKIPAIKRQ
jgi:hypothetical protein